MQKLTFQTLPSLNLTFFEKKSLCQKQFLKKNYSHFYSRNPETMGVDLEQKNFAASRRYSKLPRRTGTPPLSQDRNRGIQKYPSKPPPPQYAVRLILSGICFLKQRFSRNEALQRFISSFMSHKYFSWVLMSFLKTA